MEPTSRYTKMETPEGTIIRTSTSVELLAKSGAQGIPSGSDLYVNNKIIITYLPATVESRVINDLCSLIGPVRTSFRLICDKNTGERKGYGFLEFVRPEDANRACLVLSGRKLDGKRIRVSIARTHAPLLSGGILYVKGIAASWTVSDMFSYFRYFGNVVTVKLLVNHITGGSKGVGFVRYVSRRDAEFARSQLNGIVPELESCQLQIQFGRTGQDFGIEASTNSESPSASTGSSSLPVPSASTGSSSLPVPWIGQTFAVFVGNLKPDHDSMYLEHLFCHFGDLHSIRIVKPGNAAGHGFGFVNFKNRDQASAAILALNNRETSLGSGHHLVVNFKD